MAGDWQPIETAPKDGTRILIFYVATHGAKRTWAVHDDASYFIRLAKWDKGSWRLDMPGHFQHSRQPTHWQPLPEPPTTGSAE